MSLHITRAVAKPVFGFEVYVHVTVQLGEEHTTLAGTAQVTLGADGYWYSELQDGLTRQLWRATQPQPDRYHELRGDLEALIRQTVVSENKEQAQAMVRQKFPKKFALGRDT